MAPLPRAIASSPLLLLGALHERRGRRRGARDREEAVGNERERRSARRDRREGPASGRARRRTDERSPRVGGRVGAREIRHSVPGRGIEKSATGSRTAPWRWLYAGTPTARSGKIEDLCETPFTSINATLYCPPPPCPPPPGARL